MTKQIIWNDKIVDRFIQLACLSKDEADIVRTRAHGMSIKEQSFELGMSTDTISKKIAILKKKYDNVQPLDPDVLPKRVKNAKELYATR